MISITADPLPDPEKQSEKFRGRVAVITGASRGIGAAIARALAAQACDLVLTSRNQDQLYSLARNLSIGDLRVTAKTCDIGKADSVESLFAMIRSEFGKIDVLVNNAGTSHAMANVEQLSLEAWNESINTNLTGTFLVTRAALPLMSAGSTIVNNLSVAARTAFAGEAGYCASKHGALGFTNTLREELRPKGIRVVSLIAGPTNTEIWTQFWPDAPREKMMSPVTVARAVVDALLLPPNSTVDELTIMPTAGAL
jgi:NAD(P)-dependent dehydrogenase (short-subunit alcohol dehydrogenase family)